MANTLQNLFPFSTIIPSSALVYPCAVEFSAPITAGHYMFKDSTRLKFGKLLQQQTGVIAGVMIAGNCTPEDFAAAVSEPLMLQVYNGGNGTPVNLAPFPFSQFADGDNYSLWFNITQAANYEDDFLLAISGKVRQIANMTENELKIKIAFNFWRVDNSVFEGNK